MFSEKPDFEFLDHTADLGIVVRAESLPGLFQAAARAMLHIMVKGPVDEKPSHAELTVTGTDLEDLLVRWLGEILYLFEGEHQIVTRIDIQTLSATRLDTILQTIPYNPARHEILSEIKAVTYHQVEVAPKAGRWEARIIFDM
jgi:SHS2 domain-containing protein